MKTFQTSNGITMLACKPLSFKEEATYADGTGDKVYTISVGTMSEMWNCIYFPKENILTFCKLNVYDNRDLISFYCTTFEQASIIIYSFGLGTFDANIFDETIFTLKD